MSKTMDPGARDELIRAFPLSNLGRRLLRRITRPVGIIDVRHAAALHARASLGPMSRLDFVAELRRRYGVGQDAGPGLASAGRLPLAASLSVNARGAADLGPLAQSTAVAATAANAVSDGPSVSSTRFYRVKRPESDSVYAPADGPESLRAPLTPDDKRIGDRTGSREPNVDQIELLSSSKSVPIRPSHEPDVWTSVAELTLRAGGHAPTEQGVDAAPSHGHSASQRKSLPDATRVEWPMPSVAKLTPAPESAHLFAHHVASPIVPPSSAPANIVWRKTDSEGVSRGSVLSTHGMGPMSANQNPSRQEAGPELGQGGSASASAGAGLDVAHVAQQVRRAIAREVRVERERRGRTR
jgi:hypothetical protein